MSLFSRELEQKVLFLRPPIELEARVTQITQLQALVVNHTNHCSGGSNLRYLTVGLVQNCDGGMTLYFLVGRPPIFTLNHLSTIKHQVSGEAFTAEAVVVPPTNAISYAETFL